MGVFVYVATTRGLVAVQQVSAEEDNVQSVVCLNGTVEALPISHRYHEFVKKGTGFIHKDFGHGAFRIDVSDRIDQGNSWQLGFYLAHYIDHIGSLGQGEPQPTDKVIWATGLIKKDKSIGLVASVEAKLLSSQTQLQQWLDKGIEVQCFVPFENAEDTRIIEPLIPQLIIHPLTRLELALTLANELSGYKGSGYKGSGYKELVDHEILPQAELCPEQIGKYNIIRQLGEGGFGAVYLAQDPHLQERVAIKLFRLKDKNLASLVISATTDADLVLKQRFVDEAKALRQLSANPHIVDMYEFDVTEQGLPYYVMPYLEHSLKGVLGSDVSDPKLIAQLPPEQQPRPLPLPIGLNYLQQILTALTPVHQAGLVHRDIKPANVLFSDDNQLQLCDFGIAKMPDTSHSQSAMAMGSHHYMSPEQHESAKYVDCTSDVYSVAVLAYRMITGTLPQGRFAEPLDYQPQLSAELNQLLLRALSPQKHYRPADAETFLQLLQASLSGADNSEVEHDSDTFTEVTPVATQIKPALKPLVAKIEQLLLSNADISDDELPILKTLADIGGLDEAGLQLLINQTRQSLADKIEPLAQWLQSVNKHCTPQQAPVKPDSEIVAALTEAGRAIGLSDEQITSHLHIRTTDNQSNPSAEPQSRSDPELKPKPEFEPEPEPEKTTVEQPIETAPTTPAEDGQQKWSRQGSQVNEQQKHQLAWQQALALNTLQGYADYLRDWPEGQHIHEADEKAWQLTVQRADAEKMPSFYHSYQELFPQGIGLPYCEDKQQALMTQLEQKAQEQAWQAATSSHNRRAYDHYLMHYPDGKYEVQAKAAIEQLRGQFRRKLKLAGISGGLSIVAMVAAYLYDLSLLDDEAWQEAQLAHTPEAYLTFEQQYPDSDFIPQAQAGFRQLDEQAWQQTVTQDTAAGYADYLQAFPQGIFIEDAEQKMLALEDLLDWQKTAQENTLSAYQNYLAFHPQGIYLQEATTRLAQIIDAGDWQVAQADASIAGYQQYLSQHLGGKYAEQAQPLLEKLQLDKQALEQKQQLEQARLAKEAAEYRQLVLAVQTELKRLNYLQGKVDNVLDDITKKAIVAFQSDSSASHRRSSKLSGQVSDALLSKLKQARLRVQPLMIKQIEQAMITIATGDFMMGCNAGAGDCDSDELPAHQRTVQGFKLLSHEVSWNMYQPCISAGVCPRVSDHGWGKGDMPITSVSWQEISRYYLPWLNRLSSRKYYLPSETQWEYTARAGQTTRYSWGDNSQCDKARYGYSSGECQKPAKPTPVKQFSANPWGLYNMHGNVWEWVNDCWDKGSYKTFSLTGKIDVSQVDCDRRVIRGGSFKEGRWALRASNRNNAPVSTRQNNVGFRLARDLTGK
jgi:formylglycine-generating enzyme required for sulfatase activity/serine/threonine protein kinase